MSRKKVIEDSEEVREVIAELQAKVAASEENESEEYTEDVYEDGVYEDEYSDDYALSDSEEGYYEEEITEDIAGDTFEEAIEESVTESRIGNAVREREEERRNRRNAYREPKRREAKVEAKKEAKIEERPVKSKKKRKSKKEDDIIISVDKVTKSYVKGVPALSDVSFNIRRGEFVFIVGDSGSGKSTLIKLLLRELKPTSGTIMVNGFQVDKLKNRHIPKLRRNMGVVFQDFRLLKDRNVYENVAFAQRIIQVPGREMKKNVPNMLATVGLAGKYKAKPNELSGGEQQRVALARALVNKPPILLADEPTGNLDPKNTIEIMNLLEQINKNGTTVIVVSHNDKIVNEMQKRVITIKKGIIVSDEEKGGYIDEN